MATVDLRFVKGVSRRRFSRLQEDIKRLEVRAETVRRQARERGAGWVQRQGGKLFADLAALVRAWNRYVGRLQRKAAA
ncbi:MAG: hypothetical protein K8T25_23005 [Planctomycetia bacterium]|nr:hypothetical protein [Planctomycetia bacterium]